MVPARRLAGILIVMLTKSASNALRRWFTFVGMSKRVNTIAFGFSDVAPAALPGGTDPGVWIKIMPAGEFSGRDGRGPFDAGDKTAMQAIIDRTLAFAAGLDVMLDYDHQSIYAVQPGVGGNAPASGWFKQFEARDDGIYGRVEWTAAAAARIAAQEYRYISPLFTHFKGASAGSLKVNRIVNAALLNEPALNLTAIAAAASRFTTEEEEDVTLLARLATALGLDPAKASDDIIVTTVTAFAADRDKFAVAAGLKQGASADEVLTAMGTQKSASDPDPKQFVPMGLFTDLRDQLKALQDGTSDEKATEAVEQAIKDGKIPPANRAWALGSAKRDLADFNAFVAHQPTLTARQLTTETPKAGEPVLTDADLVAMQATGVSREAFVAARMQEKL